MTNVSIKTLPQAPSSFVEISLDSPSTTKGNSKGGAISAIASTKHFSPNLLPPAQPSNSTTSVDFSSQITKVSTEDVDDTSSTKLGNESQTLLPEKCYFFNGTLHKGPCPPHQLRPLFQRTPYYNEAKIAFEAYNFPLGNAYLQLEDNELELEKYRQQPLPNPLNFFKKPLQAWWNKETPEEFLGKKINLSEEIVSAFKNGDSDLAATFQRLYQDLFATENLNTSNYSSQVIAIRKHYGILKEIQKMKEELTKLKASGPSKEDERKIIEVRNLIEATIPFCKEELIEQMLSSPTTDLQKKEEELFRRFDYIKNNYEYISNNIVFSV